MKTKITLLIAFVLMSFTMTAQYKVSGVVKDSDGQPLPGVSVKVVKSSTGTTTDFDGNYSLKVKQGDVVEYSSVGYATVSKTMDGSAKFNIVMAAGMALDEIVLVGSRNKSRTAIDTPVPVDVIDMSEVSSIGAQVSITEILNYVAPSFTSTTQTVSDGTDHVDPASLRGLGPDQVLVLINGKRRHKSALVNVNGTVGTGTVGTDMNSIPTAAIARIEVLRDGAAAQYGSDAIAGIINLVLKKATNELTLNLNTGANMSQHSNKYDDGGIDGEKFQIDANYGVDLGKNDGYINFTGSLSNREATNRSDTMGKQIYTMFDIATRKLGYDNAYAMNYNALANYVGSLDPSLQAMVDSGVASGDSYLDIIKSDVSEYELAQRGLDRDDFRMKIGQSKLRSGQFMANMELPLDNNGSTFYANGGMSFRDGLAAGFYRRPAYSDGRGTTVALENGFLPHIASRVVDKSAVFGIKGKIGEWDVDFSNTFGTNSFDFTIKNTVNATLGASSQREFEAGGFSFAQNTTNFDVSKFYEDTFSGLNVAFGAEYRIENYTLTAGEEASWASYDKDGMIVTSLTPDSNKVYSYYGDLVPGGAQVFPGFRPTNEVDQNRNSYAGYFDVEADLTKEFLLSTALRYENYSDFGDTFTWKVASRYKLSDDIAIRAAVSTGFRAPDLHQIYYSATATQFVEGVPYEVGTFTNNSTLAGLLGIPSLTNETSQNMSLGFTAKIPDAGLKITIDGYMVNVSDRVVLTKAYNKADLTDPEIIQHFTNAAAGQARFFTNGIDTESSGVDVVIDHSMNVGKEGKLSNTLSGTFSKTEVVNIKDIAGSAIIDDKGRGYIESAMPRTKLNLTHTYSAGKYNFMLRNVYFGEVTDPDYLGTDDEQIYAAKIVTDLSMAYQAKDNLKFTFGVNNLLDLYPDEVPEDNNYGRQFIFSRRTSQFGFNGRYVFGKLTFTLK